jgi:hypothetical protein
MFSSAREPIATPPQASGRRCGGPLHIREVITDALDRVSARRGQFAEAGAAPDRSVVIRLPAFSNAA